MHPTIDHIYMGLCGSACRYTFHVCLKKGKKIEEEETGQNQAKNIFVFLQSEAQM